MSRMIRRQAALMPLLLVLSLPAPAQDTRPAADRPQSARVRLELRVNPFIAMHYWVRAQVGQPDAADRPPELNAAIAAARELESQFGGAIAWGVLDGALWSCQNAAEAAELATRLPETFEPRGRKPIKLRAGAMALVEAYRPLEPLYLQHHWLYHRRQIEAARDQLGRMLEPRQAACLEDICRSLDAAPPRDLTIPVLLVADAPEPAAFTHRARGVGAVCIVSATDTSGTTLCETVLHECIHAVDIATAERPTVLNELRRRLAAAGLSPRDRLARDVPHTLMFVQAAATVRSLLDPQHVPYGESAGYYAKVPQAAAAVVATWQQHLAGELTREQALERIVQDSTAGRPDPAGQP